MRLQIVQLVTLAGLACLPSAVLAKAPAAPTVAADAEADYAQRIVGRSDRLVAKLALTDPAQATAVKGTLLDYYRAMRAIQDERDAGFAALTSADPAPAVRLLADADAAMAKQRATFHAALSRHLSPEQVDRVKDLLTFEMVPLSIERMAKMYPGLTVPQKARLHAYLLEARDVSLNGGSAEERLDAFRVNRTRMDRYLTLQGYAVGKANAEWDQHLAERKAAEEATKAAASQPAPRSAR